MPTCNNSALKEVLEQNIVKFMFSKKVTKFDKIFTVDLTL